MDTVIVRWKLPVISNELAKSESKDMTLNGPQRLRLSDAPTQFHRLRRHEEADHGSAEVVSTFREFSKRGNVALAIFVQLGTVGTI
jgi:hypothetical protein